MSLVGSLVAFGLRQVIGGTADQVVNLIEQQFADHSQTLPKALAHAHERAWQALSISLAGDSFLDQVRVFFGSGDDKGIREQVRLFLETSTLPLDKTATQFRRLCLDELKELRKSGRLSAAALPARQVAQEAATFQQYTAPQGLIAGASQAVGQVAEALESSCPNLARLLRTPTPSGPPLLAAAFAYFFRREVERNPELAHGLFFENLQQLTVSQANAFDKFNGALSSLGQQFDAIFDKLGRIEETVVQTQVISQATHGAVLDVQALLQQLVSMHLTQKEEVRSLLIQVQDSQARARIHKGELRPQDSFSIRSEDEWQAVKALLTRFRQLPGEEQQKLPGLLNGLGKLQVGAGEFRLARQLFVEAAENVPQAAGKAEIYFNAYRAALEEKNWDEALTALKQAASLDPCRFAPFALHRYEPQRILGAGGFGTAFLCLDNHFGVQVVVKTLHTHDLERKLEEVFTEARVLEQLSHDSIIKVKDCEFADPTAKARPYLVMDFFPGETLLQHVDRHGPLYLGGALAVFHHIAEGMQAAHGQGVLHRDLKPANILLRPEGNGWQVKIIDFGLALRRKTVETSQATRSSGASILGDSVAGTLKYAPPEQTGELRGVKPGPYSDEYAFARTCCYALFGQSELRRKHWESMPKELADLLEACLEPDPKDRPDSFKPILKVLEKVAQNLDAARQQLLRQEQENALERRREGEAKLAVLIQEALNRTAGKPTPKDTETARKMLSEYDLPKERAKQIYQEVRQRWQKEAEVKKWVEDERKLRDQEAEARQGAKPPQDEEPVIEEVLRVDSAESPKPPNQRQGIAGLAPRSSQRRDYEEDDDYVPSPKRRNRSRAYEENDDYVRPRRRERSAWACPKCGCTDAPHQTTHFGGASIALLLIGLLFWPLIIAAFFVQEKWEVCPECGEKLRRQGAGF